MKAVIQNYIEQTATALQPSRPGRRTRGTRLVHGAAPTTLHTMRVPPLRGLPAECAGHRLAWTTRTLTPAECVCCGKSQALSSRDLRAVLCPRCTAFLLAHQGEWGMGETVVYQHQGRRLLPSARVPQTAKQVRLRHGNSPL